MEGITANKKNIANDKAKDRVRQRLELLEKRPVYLPKMPAWKINALNQVGEDTLRQVLNKIDNSNTCMVVRPTGFGKSYMLAGLTSSKIDDNYRFNNCLYIYPTKVIKADMVDTYGVTGGDNRANKLRNVTFITYHMIGELVKAAGLSVNKSELTDDYIEELNTSDSTSTDDDTDDNTFNKQIKIRKLNTENNIYDTSDISWYKRMIKGKTTKDKQQIKETEQLIKQVKAQIKENKDKLKELEDKKSKALVTMQKLRNTIELDKIQLEELENSQNKSKNSLNKYNDISESSETEKIINITSSEDIIAWLSSFDLILIDEAHRTGSSSFIALWQNILRDLVNNKGIKMVGATATPYRLDGLSLEQYIFGENSRLKSIDINDCIKPGNWEHLGISIDEILEDPAVIDEGTTRDELMQRGLFKEIDYVYALHNKEEFTKNVVDFLNKRRQSGNAITEENKDKLLNAINDKYCNELIKRRIFSKLDSEEKKKITKTTTNIAKEIKEATNKDMSEEVKQELLQKCTKFKNEEVKNLFIRKINYKLTTEEMKYIIDKIRTMDDIDIKLKQLVSREENYLQPDEEFYINQKINDIPNIPDLLRSTISERNRYGLDYMKFIIFFASSAELNTYIARDRQQDTKIGLWFKQAFPGYHIFEASLHTGRGTQGVCKIKADELSKFKPTDKVIDLVYCVDQLNMGYHVDNITGVILLRNTDSASVYNQQIGRCCSVRAENNTVMIDIIDKKPIDEILKSAGIEEDFGLDEGGKQKDLKYLLDSDCINICDLNKNMLEMLNNMRDMSFTEEETIRFLYKDRKADAKTIKHMTNLDKQLISEVITQINHEMKQLEKINNSEKIEY